MITFRDLIKGMNVADIPLTHQHNLECTLERANKLLDASGIKTYVTSGYRTIQHHLEIYSKRGIHPPNVPMGSAHLSGCAADLYDGDGSLMQWCRDNITTLESIGLWIEDDTTQPRVHIQTNPPRSGNRFFKP